MAPCGIPQGSVLSPLLCNLFLDSFDEALLHQHYKLVRYADDFVVLATRRERAVDAYTIARGALANVGLQLHPSKTRVTSFHDGFRYLGAEFLGDLTLPTVRQESVDAEGELVTRFVSAYPSARGRNRQDAGPAPATPQARGFTAVTTALAQAGSGRKSTIATALEKAISKRRHSERRRLYSQTGKLSEATFLV